MSRYGDCDHKCEVSSRDLDSVRWDLERKIDDQQRTINQLESRINSMRDDIAYLWDAINTIKGK